jgi:PAS domain S-box-containing protein
MSRNDSPSVLYVDLDPKRSSPVADRLRTAVDGGDVAGVESAEEARRIVDEDVACVVVDGDGSGDDAPLSLLRDVESDDVGVDTLFVTARESADLVERAYAAGVDEVVNYTGEAAVRVLEHHVTESVEVGDDGASSIPPQTHFRELAEATDDAIVTIDTDSEVRYVTGGVEALFGYSPSELVGEPLTALMSEETAARHREGFERYLRSRERTIDWTGVELVGQHREGHEVPVSVSFSEFVVDGERFFTGILRDVSERRALRIERELLYETSQRILGAESFEEGLRIALEEVGDAMHWTYGEAWTPTEDGSQLERTACRVVDASESSPFATDAAATTLERGEGLPGRVWASGDPTWVADAAADDAFLRSGRATEVAVGAALAVPVHAEDELVAALVFMLPEEGPPDERTVDATSAVASDLGRLMRRLRVETELREERALTNRILDTNPAGIVVLDDDGYLTYVNDNASEILDVPSLDDPLPAAELDVGFAGADGTHPYRTVVEEGEPVEGEFRVDVGGDERWLTVSGAPLRNGSGAVTGAIFSFQDITDRKRREDRLRQYEAMMQTVSDGIYAVDADGLFVAVNDAYTDLVGYDRSELVGEPADEFVGQRVSAEAQRLQREMEENSDRTATLETTLTTADGEVVPVEARISLFPTDGDEFGRVGVVRDIADRRRREERLALLNEVAQTLTTVETVESVAEVVVDAARETLGLPLTTVERYDDETGRLEPVARTAEVGELVGDGRLFQSERDVAWQAYANQERLVANDPSRLADGDGETPLESAIVLPIGTHGVFVTGATEPDAFGDAEVTAASILASNARAALDRVARERELRRQRDRLEERNETLERIERINDVIRSITQSLTQATSREEVERSVCEKLTTEGPYEFSWIAERATVSGTEVDVKVSSGTGDGYLDAIDSPTTGDGGDGYGPTGRAFRTREPQVQNNLHSDPPFEPWRSAAIARGFRSSIAVPLRYDETLYGVLNVYADETGAFDDVTVAVLEELGEMVGYAINAMERKKMLVSDAAVALRFELDDPGIPAIRFARETESVFEFDEVVQRADGTFRVFFSVTGVDPDDVYGFGDRVSSVTDLSFLAERNGAARFEATVTESGFLGKLVAAGAYPREMVATTDGGRVTVELPRSGDVKSFIQMFLDSFESAELVARQEKNRPVQTREEFEAAYKERLTERQEEVMRTAYFSGFFEWPRDTSGVELAEMLDISQPTVTRHIRTGERKLLDVVFDDDSGGG